MNKSPQYNQQSKSEVEEVSHKSSFFNGLTQPSHPIINSQGLLSMTKVFCQCSLTVTYHGFSILLCFMMILGRTRTSGQN